MSAKPPLAELKSLVETGIAPRAWSVVAPLRCEVNQHDPAPDDIAARLLHYHPVELGWRWGPVWSIAWFRVRGQLPGHSVGDRLALRFSCGTEATLWRDGAPAHGLDVNHTLVPLGTSDVRDMVVEFFIEAACNRPLGATTFFWDDQAEHERWREPLPGWLHFADVVRINDAWRSLVVAARFGLGLLALSDLSPERRSAIEAELRRACVTGASGDQAAAIKADARLRSTIAPGTDGSRTECLGVGHAHIDTAWLWRLEQTRRKCLRTFATSLQMLNDHPHYRFLCSQAQQYAWVERDSPVLFDRIKNEVLRGRWEPGGAMWVEPDANMPCGESLIRQIIHGTRYWRERFGAEGRQRYLYLPDTFGFSPILPQIMRLCGLDTFIANKLAWNDTNEFPHSTFLWEGIDGTRVLSHMTPGHEYNATNSPPELRKGRLNHERKDTGRTRAWLQPFGYGDGGGGPTEEMLDNLALADRCPEMPAARIATPREFVRELHARAGGVDLPVHAGELYLERHRGTYTTQAWIKRAMRRAERSLRRAEWLACASPTVDIPMSLVRDNLDEAWKLLLLNQFHDILPGSSIGEVYDDARSQFDQIEYAACSVAERSLASWTHALGGSRTSKAARCTHVVLNPASSARSGVVDINGEPRFVADVPAMGCLFVDTAADANTSTGSDSGSAPSARRDVPPVVVDGMTLSNGFVSCTLDVTGAITSLVHVPSRAEAADVEAQRTKAGSIAGVLGRLVLYRDEPKHWEAWDIDEDYLNHAQSLDSPADSWRIVESGPLRSTIEFVRRFGKTSMITQRYVLCAGSPRVDVVCRVDWREERTMLRVLFAAGARAEHATYDVSFGTLSRATGRKTPFDRARFEVPAHRWMDLSGDGAGLAVLNDCKYGHSCHANVMGLTLLRSTRFPDPRADVGEHEFAYSLMPHGGDWRRANVDAEAESLNDPMFVVDARAGTPARHDQTNRPHTYSMREQPPRTSGEYASLHAASCKAWSPWTLEHDAHSRVEIVAVKPAEDGQALVLRLAETRGVPTRVSIRWASPLATAFEVDPLEQPSHRCGLSHRDGTTTLSLGAYQIASIRAERSDFPEH